MHADKGEPSGLKGGNINIKKKKQKQSNKNNTSFLWSAMRFTEKFCSTMVMNVCVHTDPAEKAWTLTDAIFLAHI